MLKIKMPAATLGNITDTRTEIAHGPFVAVHGDMPLLAGFMQYVDDGNTVIFATAERGYYIDDTYAIYEQKNSTLVYSEVYESLWLFRALTLDDVDWLINNDTTVDSLEQLMEIAQEILEAS